MQGRCKLRRALADRLVVGGQQLDELLRDHLAVLRRVQRDERQPGRRHPHRLDRALLELLDQPLDGARLGDGRAVVGVLREVAQQLRDVLLRRGRAAAEHADEAQGA